MELIEYDRKGTSQCLVLKNQSKSSSIKNFLKTLNLAFVLAKFYPDCMETTLPEIVSPIKFRDVSYNSTSKF